jgi:hypothetical protein
VIVPLLLDVAELLSEAVPHVAETRFEPSRGLFLAEGVRDPHGETWHGASWMR